MCVVYFFFSPKYTYYIYIEKIRGTHTEMVMPITGGGAILLYMQNVFIVNFL